MIFKDGDSKKGKEGAVHKQSWKEWLKNEVADPALIFMLHHLLRFLASRNEVALRNSENIEQINDLLKKQEGVFILIAPHLGMADLPNVAIYVVEKLDKSVQKALYVSLKFFYDFPGIQSMGIAKIMASKKWLFDYLSILPLPVVQRQLFEEIMKHKISLKNGSTLGHTSDVSKELGEVDAFMEMMLAIADENHEEAKKILSSGGLLLSFQDGRADFTKQYRLPLPKLFDLPDDVSISAIILRGEIAYSNLRYGNPSEILHTLFTTQEGEVHVGKPIRMSDFKQQAEALDLSLPAYYARVCLEMIGVQNLTEEEMHFYSLWLAAAKLK